MTYVLLLAGFILLIKGADFFVDGSSSVARNTYGCFRHACAEGNDRQPDDDRRYPEDTGHTGAAIHLTT